MAEICFGFVSATNFKLPNVLICFLLFIEWALSKLMSDSVGGQPISDGLFVLTHFSPVLSGFSYTGLNTFASCLVTKLGRRRNKRSC